MPKDNGNLPKPLPADFARVRAAYVKALATAEVKKAVAQEGKAPTTSGEAPLTGKALANTIPDTTTGYQARSMFGNMTKALSNAYVTLQNYDPSGFAAATKLDAGSIKAARDYLDSTNKTLAKYYPKMPESNNALTAEQLKQLKLCVSTASTAAKTVDDMFSTSWFSELATEIQGAAKGIIHKAADTVGLDKTSTAIAVAGVFGVGFLVLAMKK